MTTPKEAERERISATLETAADAMRGGKTVKVFEFRVAPNDQYTTKVTWWPPRTGDPTPPSLILGQRYHVLFDKVPTGEKSAKGTPTFYRNFVEATPDDTPAPARDASPAPGSTPPSHHQEDQTRESIERQVAVKAAVELACARIAQGQKVGTYHVGQMADFLARVMRQTVKLVPIGKDDEDAESKAPPPAPGASQQPPGAEGAPGAMFDRPGLPAGPSVAPGPSEDTVAFQRHLTRLGWDAERVKPFLLERFPGYTSWKTFSPANRKVALQAIENVPTPEKEAPNAKE